MADIFKNKWVRFYFDPRGRATRRDFNIYYAAVAFVISIVTFVIDYMVAGGDYMAALRNPWSFSQIFNYVLIIPTFVVTARRLQDLNFSGFWQFAVYALMAAIVFNALSSLSKPEIMSDPVAMQTIAWQCLGAMAFVLIFFLFLGCKRGTNGANKYGADPLGIS